jgi:hypothetical protein
MDSKTKKMSDAEHNVVHQIARTSQILVVLHRVGLVQSNHSWVYDGQLSVSVTKYLR